MCLHKINLTFTSLRATTFIALPYMISNTQIHMVTSKDLPIQNFTKIQKKLLGLKHMTDVNDP